MKNSLGRRLVRRRPSPSMVVACLALTVALTGASYAAVVLPRNSVGTPQLKRNAVKSSKVARNTLKGVDIKESTLGRVPSAAVAANATNADKVDGVDSTQLLFRTGQSGQTFSGQIATFYVAAIGGFTLAQASYPVPLPATVADPTLEYVPGAVTATCPGIGQASAGRLCIYAYNRVNIGSVGFGGSFMGPNAKLYGFSLDVLPTAAGSDGFLQANWAYQIP